jgi:hypothetical protein
MRAPNDRVTLVTIRVRRDDDFPDDLFISLRSYSVGEQDEPTNTAEVTTVSSALDVAKGWLEDLTPGS